MLLDLQDIQAKIVLTRDDRMRFTLEYPCASPYRERVMAALSEILRPVYDGAEFPIFPRKPTEPK